MQMFKIFRPVNAIQLYLYGYVMRDRIRFSRDTKKKYRMFLASSLRPSRIPHLFMCKSPAQNRFKEASEGRMAASDCKK